MPPEPVQEVQVRGARQEAGQTTFTAAEVRQIPGAFGDAFRAIEALPGVTPILSGLPFFFVRGAPPGNTGYYLDGVRVPLLYHLGLGPSVVHPGLIDHVDFFPGGFPARYGRFAGGILSGETLPPADRFHGEANVRAFDAGALVETPFADGRGTVLVGGRYSYTAAMLSLFAPNTALQYWDYQTRVTWDLGKGDRLAVFAFGSYDSLSTRDRESQPFKEQLGTQFHRVDMRYDRALGTTGRVRVAATLGLDRSAEERGSVRDFLAALRLEVDDTLTPRVRVRGGADVAFDHYDLTHLRGTNESDVPQSEADALYPARNDLVMGIWSDLVWRLTPRVEVIPGARFDLFTSRRVSNPEPLSPGVFTALTPSFRVPVGASAIPTVDPRLATRLRLTSRASLVTTVGVSHQPPSFFVAVPGLALGKLEHGVQTSLQASEGVELALPAEVTAQATAFLHNYLGLTDFTATCIDAINKTTVADDCIDQRVRGRTLGAELLVRRALTKRLTGWLSYTLSRSTREAHPLLSKEQLQNVPSEFDRTHVVSVVGAYDLGRGWRAGGRVYAYSGRPYSRQIRGIPIAPYNSERMPGFYRFDARVEKRWVVRPGETVSLVFEWMNFTLNKEPLDVKCKNNGTFGAEDTCSVETIGPVTIPSIGLEAVW